MLYDKETLILEEVISTLLSNEIRKRPNKRSKKDRVWWSQEEKEEERRKERSSSSKACHFCHKEDHWKNDCKHKQEWLKKKGQVAEADIASGVDTKVLMASYIENNTSQGKC